LRKPAFVSINPTMGKPADIRHLRIVAILQREGYAAIDDLTGRLGVSAQTLRADMRDLSQQGRVRRHHGGASLPEAGTPAYAERHVQNAAAKATLARAAARHIAPGSAVFLSIGTTIEAVAMALSDRDLLQVVTNSPASAQVLVTSPGIAVSLTGGRMQPRNFGLSGAGAVAGAERFRCDTLLFSAGALDADGCLLDHHEDEVVVVQAMMRNARRCIAVLDTSKLGRSAPYRLGHLEEVDLLLTDEIPAWLARLAAACGTEVELALPDGG